MKLIGVRLSPFVRKVAVALSVKGIEYEHETVLPGMMPAEFVQMSPLMKIPVLQDGDLVLPDSSVIFEYLEEKYPSPSLLPETPEDRARARFMEEYGDTSLVEVAAIPFIENLVGPRYAAYIERVKAHPPVAQALEIERQAVAELLA